MKQRHARVYTYTKTIYYIFVNSMLDKLYNSKVSIRYNVFYRILNLFRNYAIYLVVSLLYVLL